VPTVDILASAIGPAVTVEAAGGRLLDVCDDAHAPVEVSCRSANCGVCRIEVLDGADRLDPPLAVEAEVLRLAAAPPGHRLACQVELRPGPGRVRLRWASGG
jgi:ferredoxin